MDSNIQMTVEAILALPDDAFAVFGKKYLGGIGQTLDLEGKEIPVVRLKALAAAHSAALAEIERLRTHLHTVIQCFHDLERDIKTAVPTYDSWPMANKAIAEAEAALEGEEK